MGRSNDRSDDTAKADESPPLWEWVVAGIGALALAVCVGYLAWDAMATDPSPPAPHVQVGKVQRVEGRFAVSVTVHNRGSRTAAELKVVGELRGPGGVIESAETVFDFLAGHSSREATFYFERDPAAHLLVVHAESGQQP